jgi:hypothetical protein
MNNKAPKNIAHSTINPLFSVTLLLVFVLSGISCACCMVGLELMDGFGVNDGLGDNDRIT